MNLEFMHVLSDWNRSENFVIAYVVLSNKVGVSDDYLLYLVYLQRLHRLVLVMKKNGSHRFCNTITVLAVEIGRSPNVRPSWHGPRNGGIEDLHHRGFEIKVLAGGSFPRNTSTERQKCHITRCLRVATERPQQYTGDRC